MYVLDVLGPTERHAENMLEHSASILLDGGGVVGGGGGAGQRCRSVAEPALAAVVAAAAQAVDRCGDAEVAVLVHRSEGMLQSAEVGPEVEGLLDNAHRVKGCHLTQSTGVLN